MRKSFHTLSGLVRNKIGGDSMNGDVYIFVNKRRNRIKSLHYETGGLSLCIECLQLLLRVGVFKLTDLVMNTLGAFGRALISVGLRKVVGET